MKSKRCSMKDTAHISVLRNTAYGQEKEVLRAAQKETAPSAAGWPQR